MLSRKKKKDKHLSDQIAINRDQKQPETITRADTWDFDNHPPTPKDTKENVLASTFRKTGETFQTVGQAGQNLTQMNAQETVVWVDELLPQSVVRKLVGILVAIYGFIGVICILLLILYCMNLLASTVLDDYVSRGDIILRIVIGLISVGAMLGMYVTFKFGDIDEQIDALQNQNKGLVASIEDVRVDNKDLEGALDAFQTQVDSICENQTDLQSQVESFEKLEKALKAEAKQNNVEIVRFLQEVQSVFGEFKLLQIQVQKANLLNLFYELEFKDDDDEGLNEEEYRMLLTRLDKQTREKMKTFEDMDRNGDGTIDLEEFQAELDMMFNKMNTKKLKLHSRQSMRDHKKKKGNAKDWAKWMKK